MDTMSISLVCITFKTGIQMTNNVVLYHDSCTDGMMSGTLMYLYFKEINQPCELVAVNYNNPIPDVTGKNVFIVDFSYSKEVLQEASRVANNIVMLDHHLTAAQQWGGYRVFTHQCEGGCNMFIALEEHKSGAGLTLQWIKQLVKHNPNSIFNNLDDDRLERVTAAVQDRDLWKFKLPKTKEIYEMLNALDNTFEAWEEVLITKTYNEFQELIKAAGYYMEIKEKLAQDYAKKAQRIDFLGYNVPIVNTPANFASRVCEILYKDEPFAVSYVLSTKEIFVSLRSDPKTGIDVSEIAKQLKGGGGHQHAAGAKLPIDYIVKILKSEL